MGAVKRCPFDGNAELCGLDDGVLLRVDGIAEFMLCAGGNVEFAPEAFSALHAAHYTRGRAVVAGCNDTLVAHDHGADLAVLLEAARPAPHHFCHVHETLIPF